MTNDDSRLAVLFLCTGNSARSILAEAILNERGGDRFRAFSAGSHPTGEVNPGALAELRRRGHPDRAYRSKSWDEFAAPAAPLFRLVFTVCDSAAGESCPLWPGHPLTVHWGIPDPAAITEPEDAVRDAFRIAYDRLAGRIDGLVALPVETASDDEIQVALSELHAAGG